MRRASLRAVLDRPMVPGVSIALDPPEMPWPVLVDAQTGWIRIGQRGPEEDREGVEFAPGAAAVLDDGRLVALWLHPERLPTHPA
jgi:hypothetical protein